MPTGGLGSLTASFWHLKSCYDNASVESTDGRCVRSAAVKARFTLTMLSCCSWNFGHEGQAADGLGLRLDCQEISATAHSQSLFIKFSRFPAQRFVGAITCENGRTAAVARRQLQFGLREKPVKLKMARCSDDSPCNRTSFSEPLFTPFHSQRLLSFTFTQ